MGAGGSRYGAGRPGWRRKCEHLLSLDIGRLDRESSLRPGSYPAWRWSRDGEPCGTIGVHAAADHVRLTYRSTPSDGDPQPFDYESRSLRVALAAVGSAALAFVSGRVLNGGRGRSKCSKQSSTELDARALNDALGN